MGRADPAARTAAARDESVPRAVYARRGAGLGGGAALNDGTHARQRELLEAFHAFEGDGGLWEASILDQRYWHEVRADLFEASLRALGSRGQYHARVSDLPLTHWLRPRVRYWPSTLRRYLWSDVSRADLLVLNHPRHALDRGRWICTYTQPLLDGVPHTRWILEEQYQGQYHYPSRDEPIKFLDFALIRARGAFLVREASRRGFTRGDRAQIDRLVEGMRAKLGAAPSREEAVRRVRTAVLTKLALRDTFARLLDRVQPRVILHVVHYHLATLILTEIARARGIPVVELQHGGIDDSHVAYNLAPGCRPPGFPDYLLLFGAWWREVTPGLPLPPTHTPSIGFAWLEAKRQEASGYPVDAGAPRVLFLSQGSIGAELSKLAVSLQQLAGAALRIAYRLHPGEAVGWRAKYPWLETARIEVELPSETGLYTSLARSRFLVGVGSTAVFEGLAFRLPAFIVPLSGYEQCEGLVTAGAATLVHDAAELHRAISARPRTDSNALLDRIWRPDAVTNFRVFLDGLLSR